VASEVVDDLLHLNLIVGQTPYRHSCVRIAPSILNSDEDINLTIDRLKDYLNAS
jgi:4-aminobutyrate aminotransferase-like enzyme